MTTSRHTGADGLACMPTDCGPTAEFKHTLTPPGQRASPHPVVANTVRPPRQSQQPRPSTPDATDTCSASRYPTANAELPPYGAYRRDALSYPTQYEQREQKKTNKQRTPADSYPCSWPEGLGLTPRRTATTRVGARHCHFTPPVQVNQRKKHNNRALEPPAMG